MGLACSTSEPSQIHHKTGRYDIDKKFTPTDAMSFAPHQNQIRYPTKTTTSLHQLLSWGFLNITLESDIP